VKAAIADAVASRRRTVIFLDEIHRFSKLQQDSLLRGVEDGSVCLIGATTENVSVPPHSPFCERSLLDCSSADDVNSRRLS